MNQESVEITRENIEIADITLSEALQPRTALSEEKIEEYTEYILDGTIFPPVEVFGQEGKYILVDGFHRVKAFQKAGKLEIAASIHSGSLRDATLFAVGANSTHGLPRSNDDKRKAVLTLLNDEEWRQWSDGAIARQCAVSQPFVTKVRHELTHNGYESPNLRTGADGRTTDTSHIGKIPSEASAAPSAIQKRMSSAGTPTLGCDDASLPAQSTSADPSTSHQDDASGVDDDMEEDESLREDPPFLKSCLRSWVELHYMVV